MMHKRSPVAAAVGMALAGGAFCLSNVVYAQDNVDEQADKNVEEVVVTGSRLRRDGFSSSAPMDVVITNDAVVRGLSDVGTLLQTTTVAAGSPQVTSATSTAFVQNGGTGATTLSLRGLGANRTLTLLNGRRAGPAGTRGGTSSFDLNVLPLAALERVEILKDGASSIYGSDAVAGVVNFITRKDTGGSIDVYTSQPTESGGEESRLSASYGKEFERGYFRVTADYLRESELAKGDRDYFACGEQFIFDPNTGERRDVIDPRTGRPHCTDLLWGHVWLYDYQGAGGNVPSASSLLAQFDYDGDLGQFVPGYASDPTDPDFLGQPGGFFPVRYDRASDGVSNADHPFQDASSLIPETELFTVYGEAEFEINEDMTAYAEVLLNRRETFANGYRQYWTYVYNENWNFGDGIGPGNGSTLSTGWTGAQWLSPTPITDHNDSTIEVEYTRFVGGLKGDFGENWGYDVSYQYSFSDGDYFSDQVFNDSIADSWFASGSCVGTTTSVRGVPCLDPRWLDPEFLRGNVTAEERAFLFGTEVGSTEYTQWSVEGYVTGNLFEMPAGPAGVVLGIHYREDEIADIPGNITLSGNAWNTSTAGITAGDDATKAIFTELELPLFQDRPFARSMTLSLSGRYTDVDSYGSGNTYKVGLNWLAHDTL
ncbi:MAG: TonB-dependent receptor plug domain-containing protein, partial [Pseudomonadota bacterium]